MAEHTMSFEFFTHYLLEVFLMDGARQCPAFEFAESNPRSFNGRF
jgi:hypothetical protein